MENMVDYVRQKDPNERKFHRATTWTVPILAVLSRWWMPFWIKALYRISWKDAYTNAAFI